MSLDVFFDGGSSQCRWNVAETYQRAYNFELSMFGSSLRLQFAQTAHPIYVVGRFLRWGLVPMPMERSGDIPEGVQLRVVNVWLVITFAICPNRRSELEKCGIVFVCVPCCCLTLCAWRLGVAINSSSSNQDILYSNGVPGTCQDFLRDAISIYADEFCNAATTVSATNGIWMESAERAA